jgi:Zn-dependent alcohol dehydrogenase
VVSLKPIDIGGFDHAESNRSIRFLLSSDNSNLIVVAEHFVLKIPQNLSLDKVAPLLCADITIYSALRQHNVEKDTRMG